MTDARLVFSNPRDGILLAPPHCGLLAVPGFVHAIQRACATNTRKQLVVDLSQVETLETVALRTLLWARRYCTARWISLAVAPPASGVLPPQRETLLHDLFPIPAAAAQHAHIEPRPVTRSQAAQLPPSPPTPPTAGSVAPVAALRPI